MKKKDQHAIEIQLCRQLKGTRIKSPVRLHYTFYEDSRRRDLDNVSGYFHKIFQDALVKTGYLPNDGWKDIIGFSDRFEYNKIYPHIEIEIEEV